MGRVCRARGCAGPLTFFQVCPQGCRHTPRTKIARTWLLLKEKVVWMELRLECLYAGMQGLSWCRMELVMR